MNSFLLIIVFVHLCWVSLSLSAETVCIGSERETLLKLKHHIIDPSNRLSSWNASLNPNCCHWYGVLCNNVTSYVVELHLNTPLPSFPFDESLIYETYEEVHRETFNEYSRRAFSGEINPCLVDLKHLNYLDLSGNLFQTPFPSFIAKMTSLTHLNLSDAGFMGNIPPQIGNLSNLLYLDLSVVANGTIPSQIGNLSNLLHLDLGGSYYYEIVDWLSSLSNLRYLHLSHTHPLHLHLSGCTLSSYNQPSFVNFSSLITLDLSYISYHSTISFIPKWVFGLKKLVSLFLDNNYFEGPIPDGIRNLTLLENLDLRGNSLSSSIPHWLFGVLSHLKFLDLSSNNLQGVIPDALGSLTSLIALYMEENQLKGPIPTSLGKVTSLVTLDLSYNQLSGNLTLDYYGNNVGGEHPKLHGKISSLRVLRLSSNQLGGNPFKSLGSLSKLLYLDIDDNNFQGVVNESHLENLICLRSFHASGNKLTLKVDRNWHPTFQLTNLDMSSWQLGPNFPSWTHSQNELLYLKMSNTGILDYIPPYFWEACYSLEYLNFSNNYIHGKIENSLSNPILFEIVDLSSNHLHGKLPIFSSQVGWLDLSDNSFSSMNDFLCRKKIKKFNLYYLNLALNNLSGKIPDCWIKWPYLLNVNLQSNLFVGNMPLSMGSLVWLQSLNIRNNSLSGIFPIALKKNNKLISLDIGENNLSGTIPTWIGEKLPEIKILRLRSNNFSGHIPNGICDMIFLQDFDLAQNSFSGNIPKCLNNFSAMFQKNKSTDLTINTNDERVDGRLEEISIILWTKGRPLLYNSILGLVTNVDLSNNNLSGEIPREITYLDGLIYLNLSGNQLSGQIPPSIGNMRLLESIDLSWNQLSGKIPPTVSNLSFLNNLDLSHNHLEGKIPTGTQIQSFEASDFVGNNLCGPPLSINCTSNQQIPYVDRSKRENGGHGVNWFFVSFTVGFIVGFWIIIAPLLIYRSWRYAYFCFLDNMWYKVQSYW
ncbi:probable leucine-rich repeat receptor-like protein kinase At1g35710 [Vigna radiata var. radiata]|uniref:Probable leucine-rich repeat receptor-like protein kinase At1g35710 n=1 Tax=Vigna radiata var. radiata TaxID=3916 RepID=A0A3Q0EXW8_VIGRR|nr:probable leucine-rich repeat receptor-like protein kinase At1g35710 [Vigna radiata var. radiata]